MDGHMKLVKGGCKRLLIKFSTTNSLHVWPSLENLGFDDGNYIIFCGFHVFKVIAL